VVAERRKYRRSPTLAALSQYIAGESDSLPSHLIDLIGDVDRDTLRRIFERLVDEVY